MNNKKCRLVLWGSFTVFALSVIAVILSMIASYYKIKTDFPNDDRMLTEEIVAMVIVGMCAILPSLASELSCARSVYKILKYEPTGHVKACYIVSASLAFLALVFQCLTSAGLINFVGEGGQNYTVEVLLFTQWPAFILSFVLGSIPIKHESF